MATKVMVSSPKEFLAEVDRVDREEHRSRSEFLRETCKVSVIFQLFVILCTGTAHPERVGG